VASARSTAAEKARRLNHAREVWERVGVLPTAVTQLMQEYGIGRRHAYRYVERARRLKGPLAVPDATESFTVKLSRRLAVRVRAHAAATGRPLREVVTPALVAHLARSGGRG
jgi:hypothetical protein